MSDASYIQPPGWYHAEGDPAGTKRYWDGNLWQGGPRPVPGGDDHRPSLADPAQRIVARLIDGVVWVGVAVAVAVPVGVIGALLDTGTRLRPIGGVLAILMIAVYELVMVATRGGTVGKLALGLRVTTADGAPPGIEPAARRVALLAVYALLSPLLTVSSVLFAAGAIAGLIMLFVDQRRQTPWDKVSGTEVRDV